MGSAKHLNGLVVMPAPATLEALPGESRLRVVFVKSMPGLFHDALSLGFIQFVFAVMNCASRHTFQASIKRPGGPLR